MREKEPSEPRIGEWAKPKLEEPQETLIFQSVMRFSQFKVHWFYSISWLSALWEKVFHGDSVCNVFCSGKKTCF